MNDLLSKYHRRIKDHNLVADPQQEEAIALFEKLLVPTSSKKTLLSKKQSAAKQGIYLYGPVGRGKTMLMDLFYDFLPANTKKKRIHFHAFMIGVHEYMHTHRGDKVDDMLPRYAKEIAKDVKYLCFDEFHVTDVADAMILDRLFTALFAQGLIVVLTSNFTPESLYEGGLQRDRFIPFIDLLEERLYVHQLDGGQDYRRRLLEGHRLYLWPLGAESAAEFEKLFSNMTQGQPSVPQTLHVKGHRLEIPATVGPIARCSFHDLCEKPLGAEDYITLASQFQVLFLENIPQLGEAKRNEAKRLMLLVDVLYEHRRLIIATADAPPEKIYAGHDHSFEFDRTISRLTEMQSPAYSQNMAKM
ncbi:MAG: cell division protein ZapE [Alphaproteobacteria bacterium]|nr:cell division protein ZapE [Alphaproteobacteria bacterium]